MLLTRNTKNPLLCPDPKVNWEAQATFNPCIVEHDHQFHLLYRAIGKAPEHSPMSTLSTIGYANSHNGIDFEHRRQLIAPTETWEQYGCEDPRVTYLDGKYYIFYTVLSEYPYVASGIRVGLAITKDFQTITQKHLITPFNAKAMALFPERIDGKLVAIVTVNTDKPPAKIAIAKFSKESDMWSEAYWSLWYQSLDHHMIPLLRKRSDHLEVGAPPLKTEKGWLLLYSYIQNYFSQEKIFGTEAVLLDLTEPQKVIGIITSPLILPEEKYEKEGDVPNIVFPSGAYIESDHLHLYYGAADTTCCLATGSVQALLEQMTCHQPNDFYSEENQNSGFQRYVGNPIISPILELEWESIATFNPGAIYLGGCFHIIYRALGSDFTSVFGYAKSYDGLRIDERSPMPIYQPKADFEQKLRPGYSGCEDPRLTLLDNTIYMFYTAFDGYTPRVAFTSISVEDFLKQNWNWTFPIVITPPGNADKNACLFPKKINNQYVLLHRNNNAISINFMDNINFGPNEWLDEQTRLIQRESDYFYNIKFGSAAPPIETPYGWILFYHRVTRNDRIYKVGAALLDLHNPRHLLKILDQTLLEPIMDYERHGLTSNVVFPCGVVLLQDYIYMYYGCADSVISVAKISLQQLLALFGIHITEKK